MSQVSGINYKYFNRIIEWGDRTSKSINHTWWDGPLIIYRNDHVWAAQITKWIPVRHIRSIQRQSLESRFPLALPTAQEIHNHLTGYSPSVSFELSTNFERHRITHRLCSIRKIMTSHLRTLNQLTCRRTYSCFNECHLVEACRTVTITIAKRRL